MHDMETLRAFLLSPVCSAYLVDDFPSLAELEFLTNCYFLHLEEDRDIFLSKTKYFLPVQADVLRVIRELRLSRIF